MDQDKKSLSVRKGSHYWYSSEEKEVQPGVGILSPRKLLTTNTAYAHSISNQSVGHDKRQNTAGPVNPRFLARRGRRRPCE
jgi:hypothetical protein